MSSSLLIIYTELAGKGARPSVYLENGTCFHFRKYVGNVSNLLVRCSIPSLPMTKRLESTFHAGPLARSLVLLSPDERFANRFRDKHARPPLYDRRGKFAGKMADDILYRFTGVPPRSTGSLPIQTRSRPRRFQPLPPASPRLASPRLVSPRCAQGVLIEMFIVLWDFAGFRASFEFSSLSWLRFWNIFFFFFFFFLLNEKKWEARKEDDWVTE